MLVENVIIKTVTEKSEQRGNYTNTIFEGVIVLKEKFQKGFIELPFVLREFNSKKAEFYKNNIMQTGKSVSISGSFTMNNGTLTVLIDNAEYTSFKYEAPQQFNPAPPVQQQNNSFANFQQQAQQQQQKVQQQPTQQINSSFQEAFNAIENQAQQQQQAQQEQVQQAQAFSWNGIGK